MATEKGIPTEEELKRLPRWARVAFAARCARRVSPAFMLYSTASPVQRDDARCAIEEAETSASLARPVNDHLYKIYKGRLQEAGEAALYALAAAVFMSESEKPSARAAVVARDAIARFAALGLAYRPEALGSLGAAAGVENRVVDLVNRATRFDFDLLAAAAKAEHWTDNTPVPPQFFGTLWPFGVPDGWPEKEPASQRQTLVIEVAVPQGTSKKELLARIEAVALRANELHKAYGGHGLKVDHIEVEAPVGAPEGVPV